MTVHGGNQGHSAYTKPVCGRLICRRFTLAMETFSAGGTLNLLRRHA
jgi:hypothetical protein